MTAVPFLRVVAHTDAIVTNRLMIRPAGRPPVAILRHVGPVSGREYRIPLGAFPADDGFVFAPTDGPDSDWAKNVLAAGGATLEYEDDDPARPRMIDRSVWVPHLPASSKAFTGISRVDHVLRTSRG